MKRALLLSLLTVGCVSQPIPVRAQTTSISPELVTTYAALGAAVMAKRYLEQRDYTQACQALRHQIELSAAAGRSFPASFETQRLICNR